MNRRQLILTLVAGATLSLHAQHYVNPNEASLYKEEAARLTEEEFYYGSQNLKATKDEALTLINAYYLNTPGTRLRIGEWLDAHKPSKKDGYDDSLPLFNLARNLNSFYQINTSVDLHMHIVMRGFASKYKEFGYEIIVIWNGHCVGRPDGAGSRM